MQRLVRRKKNHLCLILHGRYLDIVTCRCTSQLAIKFDRQLKLRKGKNKEGIHPIHDFKLVFLLWKFYLQQITLQHSLMDTMAHVFFLGHISLDGSESRQSRGCDNDSRLSNYGWRHASNCTNPAWQAVWAMFEDSVRGLLILQVRHRREKDKIVMLHTTSSRVKGTD